MKIQGKQTKDNAVDAAQAIAEALPVLPGVWKRSRIAAFGVKTILVLMAMLIGMPNPRVLACACTEVVGGSGAVSSDLSVADSDGSLALVQSDIKLPGVIPVTLTRTYKSDSTLFGMFGPGWMVDIVSFLKTTSGNIDVHFHGNVETFDCTQGYVNKKKTMKLSFTGPSEVTVLERESGAQWVFSLDDSTLKQYIDRNGNHVSYTWKKIQKTVYLSFSSNQGGGQISSLDQDIYCPLTVTYPDGRQMTFSYDTTGDYQYLCRQVTGPAGTTVSYTYTDGLLTGVNMGGGQVLSYAYHEVTDNVKTVGWLTKISYANAAEVNIGYNGGSPLRVTSVTGPQGYSHTYGYEGTDPNLTTTRTDSLNHSKSFAYTNNQQNKLITDALSHTTNIVNNALFQPVTVTNAKGKSTAFLYDSSNTDPLAQRNLLSRANPLGKTWNYTWDSNYNMTTIVDPLGHSVGFTYDGNHNLLTAANSLNQTIRTNTYTSQGLLATTADGRGNTTGFTYNVNGFLTKLTDAAGKEWNRTYDSAGNLLTSTDPLGNTTSRTYNGFKKVATATDALANTTGFTYDEMSNLTSMTDANNNVTSFSWDQFQRKTAITNALNNTTTFTYDTETNLTTLTDPLNHAYGYTFDAVNNTKTFTFPDNSHESYDYGETNHLTKKTDRAGQQISYAYDDTGRLKSKKYFTATVFGYSYDDANRLTRVARAYNDWLESSIDYTYNAANQVTSIVADGLTIGYGYDNSQNVNKVTYPSGAVVNYGYDNRNRLNSITDASNHQIVGYTKGDAGRITKRTYPNGLESVYTYDADNRVTQIALRQSATPANVIQSFAYGYDAVGNRLWVKYKDGTGDVYKYDATYQVVGVKYGVSNPQAGYDAALPSTLTLMRTVTYAYDAVGNRTSVTDDGNSSTYTINNLDQYTAVSGTNYTYSARGDLTGDGTWTYGYDYEGHLVSASKTGETVTYKYDPLGRRIEKDINGVAAAKYVYSGKNLIEERNGTGSAVTASYVYSNRIDRPVQVIKGGNTYFFQQDALGNVTSLTNITGSIVEQYSYDVYGNPTIKDGSGTILTTPMTPFLFTGREFDSETKLYHYRTRAYSPTLGRFLQPDSINFSGRDVNLYRYLANNPVNAVDPNGLQCESVDDILEREGYYDDPDADIPETKLGAAATAADIIASSAEDANYKQSNPGWDGDSIGPTPGSNNTNPNAPSTSEPSGSPVPAGTSGPLTSGANPASIN